MRVVLDTNILISALLVQLGYPAAIYSAWQEGFFTLLICREQLDELRATLHKPAIAERIKPYSAKGAASTIVRGGNHFAPHSVLRGFLGRAGRLVNQLKELAEDIGPLPRVERSPDPTDDFLLALSEAGNADYLVTGDKSGLLVLARHHATRIVPAREFAALFA
ncbi:MAG: PIN domain-containing protein [Bryobacteraceae bacterium]